ncbi:host attachment protein [Undibacterium arcticum]|uniref:Host attachment protein n=1 Tax=Undibacterium arcticum TaxID=1762892 RepID=A0ABV7FAT8_9BURK
MQTTWIVAADSSRARIFERLGTEPNYREIADLANPQGRASNRELVSDGYGNSGGGGGGGGAQQQAHIASPKADAVQHETELFSKEVSRYLDRGRIEHRYDRICMIAPPQFLGLMRQNLSKEAQKLVAEEIAKNVSWFEPNDIQQYIAKAVHVG